MNRLIIWGIWAVALSIFLLFGCSRPTRVEMDYGTSFRLQKFNQTLNLEGEKDLELVKGLDGNAAAAIVDQYHKGFSAAEKESTYNISIGGGGATGLGIK